MPTIRFSRCPAWIALFLASTGSGCNLPQTGLPATSWVGSDADSGVSPRTPDAFLPADTPSKLDASSESTSVADSRTDATSPSTCQSLVVDLTQPEGNVLILADRSTLESTSNKGECTGCTTYWNSLKDAIAILTGNLGDQFHFGLKLFPSAAAGNVCQVTAAMDVPVSSSGAQEMLSLLASTSPGGEAPVTLGMRSAISYLGALPADIPAMIVLAMAGLPTCGGADNTQDDTGSALEEIRRSAAMVIPVYVLAVGDSQSQLDAFGQMGSTGPAYSVYQPEALLLDMQNYAMANAPCTVTLPVGGVSSSSVNVYFDGNPVNDFALEDESSVVVFSSEACNQLRSLTVSSLTIEINCP
jgi:hypothetical protein